MTESLAERERAWPALPLAEWEETRATLHMWTQIVGKVRLALSPRINHWWEVPLYVSSRGLTTSAIPYGEGVFEVEFGFIEHFLQIRVSDGRTKTLKLRPQSVADFYREFMTTLESLGIHVKIWAMPVEIPNPIRFDEDRVHASYDPEYANRFWRILVTVNNIFTEFRAGFIGKCSPVHFFWGSFDLAVTRFSGRPAPERPGADAMTREAYSHEVSSAGWWPGSAEIKDAAFYSYAAPAPDGFGSAAIRPKQAFFNQTMGLFVLPYDEVRRADSPRTMLLEFLRSTYEAAANLAKWDRASLERKPERAPEKSISA
jgi:hypothetical protein